MTFSEYAGIAIVPTLSRLVLAAAFVATGYNKVFKTFDEFTAEQATTLKSMGIEPTPVKVSTSAQPRMNDSEPRIVPVSFQESPAPPSTAPSAPAEKPQTPATSRTTTTTPPHTVISNALPPGQYSATAMYRIALLIHDKHWGISPALEKWLAIAAAYTELVGGAMLLIGLLTRFWALGLSIVMVVAFYMTSVQPLAAVHGFRDYFNLAENPMGFSTMFIQLAFFVLAFGLMLTGAGPLSLDRLLFGGPRVSVPPAPPPPPERPMRYERNV